MRPTYAEIDLSALRHNIAALRARLPKDTCYMAVVKANAYGHGMVEIAKAALRAGAGYLGVAIPEEGIALRENGITAPVLVMGGILPAFADSIVEYELCATVFSLPVLRALQQAAAERNKTARIHIKVDTGMNRVGVKTLDELRILLHEAAHCKAIELAGMFTHFAVSEIEDKTFTHTQNAKFREAVALARGMGFSPLVHAANSGGILDLPGEAGYDMARGGIAMYGYSPGEHCGKGVELRPVLSWKTAIVHIKEIQPGDTVSYGRRYTAAEPRRIATLPLGYGDGYSRCMTGKAEVILRGKKAPVVGTICMDQLMVDVTEIADACVGDEVLLIGASGQAEITADDLAGWANTISYEVLLDISARVPRVYINR